MANNYIRFDIPYLKKIPLPNLSTKEIKELKTLYMRNNQDDIDEYVCKLYDLNIDEINAINGEFNRKESNRFAA